MDPNELTDELEGQDCDCKTPRGALGGRLVRLVARRPGFRRRRSQGQKETPAEKALELIEQTERQLDVQQGIPILEVDAR